MNPNTSSGETPETNGDFISGLLPSHYQLATSSQGIGYYIDRSYVFTNLPSKYNGLSLIKTANEDKRNPNIQLNFDVSEPVTVYIAFDPRNTLPGWLNSFTKTSEIIGINDLKLDRLEIWKKEFSPGKVNLGPNVDQDLSQGVSMYVVLVEKKEQQSDTVGCGLGSGSDINNDGIINIMDLVCIVREFGGFNQIYDLNGDSKIDVLDLVKVARLFS